MNNQLFYLRIILALFIILGIFSCDKEVFPPPPPPISISWKNTEGPNAGEVSSLVVTSDGIIFTGTKGGGVFKSTDNGENWESFNAGLADQVIHSLALDAIGQIYAGTNSGVFRSSTNEDNWSQRGLNSILVWSLGINSDGSIFAGANNDTLYRLTSNGNSWDAILNATALSLAFAAENNIVVGTNRKGIYISNDGGDTWNIAYPSDDIIQSLLITQNDDIFAGTLASGVLWSTDGGASWHKLNNNELGDNTIVYAFAIDSEGQIFAGCREVGVYCSKNRGDSWEAFNNSLTSMTVYSLVLNMEEHLFAGTESGFVFRTTESTKSSGNVSNEPD